MKINWSVKFFAYKRRGSSDASIRMRVTLRGETPIDIATGFVIPINDWNPEAQKASNGHSDLNREIDEWRAQISECFARYELIEKRKPTRGEIRDLFNDTVGRKSHISIDPPDENADFFKAFDSFTQTMGLQNNWTKTIYQKFAVVKKYLMAFDPLLSFSTLDESKLQRYLQHLYNKGFKNTTVAKQLDYVRWFLRWANRHGYYPGNLHDTFKPKIKGADGKAKEIIYLTSDELKMVESYRFTPRQYVLERSRDVFVFCCYCGLRYSDVRRLKRSDIINGEIRVVTQKTRDGLRIELNAHTKAILEKYKETPIPGGLALPVTNNAQMNLDIKDIGKLCGIDTPTRIVYFKGNERIEETRPKYELLSTHAARRTFVVMALSLGIPSEVIMRWTGHNNFDAMKPYMAIVDEIKKNSMLKFDGL